MANAATTSGLRAYLAARRSSPEGQAVAVLATALRSSPRLQHALFEQLGHDRADAVRVRSEVETGHGHDKVDLEIRAYSRTGALERRIWIEAKVGAALAKAVHGEDGEVVREAQLVRYRDALNARDNVRPDLPPSVLVLLIPGRANAEDKLQAELSGAQIVQWETVGEIAAAAAFSLAGVGWRRHARRPDSSIELGNLEQLVWFLESAERHTPNGRRRYVGIDPVSEPLTLGHLAIWPQLAAVYAALESLGDACATRLEDIGWAVVEADELDDTDDAEDAGDALPGDLDGDDADERADLAADMGLDFQLTPREKGWWSLAGEAWLWLRPFEGISIAPSDDPVMEVGIAFDDAEGPAPSPGWLETLEEHGLLVEIAPDQPNVKTIWAQRPLAWICELPTASGQADRLAGWVVETFEAIAAVPPLA